MTRWTTMTLVMAMAMAAGCGDSGGDSETDAASTAGLTGSTGGTGGETPTTTEDPSSGGTTGAAGLTPEALVGNFKSAGCERYPNGMGGDNYLTRDFTLTASTWHLDLVLYGDAACTAKLFSAVIDGPYALVGPSATVEGATEGNFSFATIVWTAHMQSMADTFTMAGCGGAPWEVEVPQDVTATGCIGVAHPIAECPVEYDVVALDGDDLFFGERITDMCVESGRPAALGPFPVVRA